MLQDKLRKGLLVLVLPGLLTCQINRINAQAFTPERMKAEFTLLLAGYVNWEDEENIDNFRIGVLSDQLVFNELSFKAGSDRLKTKPFDAVYLKQINDISGIHILYVGKERNADIRRIINKINGQPVLMVTDSLTEYELVMINLLALNKGGKAFELNKKNIDEAGLSISNKILYMGGKEDDLREIYRASEKELEKVRDELVVLNADLALQQQLLEKRKVEIDSLNREVDRQMQERSNLADDIREQQAVLAEKNDLLSARESELRTKEAEISSQNDRLQQLLQDIESSSKILQDQRLNMQLQTRQIEAQRSILEKQTVIIEKQQGILYLFGSLIILFTCLIFIVIWAYNIKRRANRILKDRNESIKRQNAEITRQKEEILAQGQQLMQVNRKIEKQNQNITSSIYYALTIQQAILPLPEELDKYFENFVIFLPKDIVSGDFYWISHVHRTENLETIFIAVADCTGHGVPGGFLSMVGTRLLNAIVAESRIFEPREILYELDERFRKALKQDRTENDDGMDLCLCRIERQTGLQAAGQGAGMVSVCFAGARRPLFYTNGDNDIVRLHGDRKTVGGSYPHEVAFSEEKLELNSNSILYLTTDGLADQPSPEREKFGINRLIRILSSCKHLSMQEQKRNLEEELLKFQKYENQRDDITVMGIRL